MQNLRKNDFENATWRSDLALPHPPLTQVLVLSLCLASLGTHLVATAAHCAPAAPMVASTAAMSWIQEGGDRGSRDQLTDQAPKQFDSEGQDSQRRSPERQESGGVEQLIGQLGSPSYAIRQAAVERIWRLGNSAKPALEKAANLGDPEIAKRASEILTVLAMGIDFETEPELAKLVLRFNGSEKEVKSSVLSGLLREERLPLVFELMEQVESDEDQRWLFNQVLDFNRTIMNYGRTGRWDELEFILQHPLTIKHNPIAVVQFRMAVGQTESLVEQLEQRIAEREKDGKKVELKGLLELISILRMQRRFEEAQSYIAKIENREIQNRFSIRILIEKGDWAEVAKKMPGPDQDVTAENGLIKVSDSQRALVYKFSGDEAGYQKVIEKMIEQSSEEKSNGNEEKARQILDNVLEIAMVGLDWDLVYQHLDFEDTNSTFGMLIESRRIDEAFKLIQLGETVEKRDLWVNRKMRHIASLRKKIERLKNAREDYDEAEAKLSSVWRMCLGSEGVVNALGSLGLTDEAAAHYHTMFANLSSDRADDLQRRFEIVARLVWMGRYEEARMLCETGFSSSEIDQVAGKVAEVHKRSFITFWMNHLKRRYPDPIQRLNVAAGIVNSPFCDRNDFDLQLELANVEPNPKHLKSGYWDFQLAQVYRFHGDDERYELHLQIADQAGYSGAAGSDRVKRAVLSGDWEQVIEFYDSPPNNTSVFSGLLAAEGYRQRGYPRESALRTAFAFAGWQQNYENSGTTYLLDGVDKQHLATDFLKLQVYHSNDEDGSRVSNERYRRMLAQSQLQSDPEAANVNHQIVLFDQFANDNHGGGGLYVADEVIRYKMALSRGLIAKGEFDEALQMLMQCDKFAPGDPSLGEKLIPALDEAGGSKQAEQLFEQMSGFYFDLLAKFPESSLHHNNYAWLCACAKRRKDHMLRHAEIAVQQRPNASSYLDTLATVYFLVGEKEKAIELCHRCIQLYPTRQHYRDQLIRFSAEQ